jgi:hypothetical protein
MRVLGVLGAVAALLAAYLLFFDHDPRDRAGHALARVEPSSVGRVAIARAGEAPFALVRAADGGWRIQPGDGAADPAAVEDLVNALALADSDRTADLSGAAAGLAPPRVSLSIDDAHGATELRLGRGDASGSGVFVQVGAGGPVHVGPRRLLELADRPASAFVDRRPTAPPVRDAAADRPRSPTVLDFAHFDVRELTGTINGASIFLKTPDGEHWTGGGKLNEAALQRLISALGNLRAETFLARPPLFSPTVVLDVLVQAPGEPEPTRHEVELWDGCVARAEGKVVFRVPRDACEALRSDPRFPSEP